MLKRTKRWRSRSRTLATSTRLRPWRVFQSISSGMLKTLRQRSTSSRWSSQSLPR